MSDEVMRTVGLLLLEQARRASTPESVACVGELLNEAATLEGCDPAALKIGSDAMRCLAGIHVLIGQAMSREARLQALRFLVCEQAKLRARLDARLHFALMATEQ